MKSLKFFSLAGTFFLISIFSLNTFSQTPTPPTPQPAAQGASYPSSTITFSCVGLKSAKECDAQMKLYQANQKQARLDEQSHLFAAAMSACSNFDRKNLSSTDSCDYLKACKAKLNCGDLPQELQTCVSKLKADVPEIGGITLKGRSADTTEEEGDDSESGNSNQLPDGPFVKLCLEHRNKTPTLKTGKEDSLENESKRFEILNEFNKSPSKASDGVCQGMNGAALAKFLSERSKDSKDERKSTMDKYNEAKKSYLSEKAACAEKKVSLQAKIAASNAEMQKETARLKNEAVEKDAQLAMQLTTMQGQLRSLQNNVEKLKVVGKQQLDVDYYDEQEKVKQACYDSADSYIDKVKAAQLQQEGTMQNKASSTSHALTNASMGGNAGQNAKLWQAYIQKCLARRSGYLTSLYNKNIVRQQDLANQINQNNIQIAELMTKIGQTQSSMKQSQIARSGIETATLASINQKTQAANAELQTAIVNCQEKLKQESDDRDDAEYEFRLAKRDDQSFKDASIASLSSSGGGTGTDMSASDLKQKLEAIDRGLTAANENNDLCKKPVLGGSSGSSDRRQ